MSAPSPRAVQPPGWPRPSGYSNGMAARGEVLAVAGQIGWDEQQRLVSTEFGPQFRRALENVIAVVRAAGGQATDVVSMTIYVTDVADYRADVAQLGLAWREVVGRHFPAVALVQVAGLLEPGARVEIQALAVLAGKEPP
jgi:enamine deaminase RidA (YjgF/YER057c/UK114 family)